MLNCSKMFSLGWVHWWRSSSLSCDYRGILGVVQGGGSVGKVVFIGDKKEQWYATKTNVKLKYIHLSITYTRGHRPKKTGCSRNNAINKPKNNQKKVTS